MMAGWRMLLPLISCLAAPALAQPVPEATRDYGRSDAPFAILVRSTTDIALFGPVLDGFVAANPDIRVDYEQWGSNDLYAVSLAECRSGAETADLLISSAVDHQVKLVNDGCARSHISPLTEALPAEANWRDELFGITQEPAVMVYNSDLVPAQQAPRTRFDLIDLLRPEGSRYEGKVATYDIEESGLGYLFAFVDAQQATTFGSLIEAFARSRAVSTCCSAEIIDGVASGQYVLAYNVLGSYALDRAEQADNLVVVAPQDYTLVLSRGAMIPRNAPNPVSAGLLLDFLVSDQGRRAMAAEHLYGDDTAVAPDSLGQNEAVLRPIPLSPVLLVGLDRQKRAHFLALWRDTFARPQRGATTPSE